MLSPQIQAFDLRVGCAANLKDLWYDLGRYRIVKDAPRHSEELLKPYTERGYVFPPNASASHVKVYPLPDEWCDALVRDRGPANRREVASLNEQHCPSAGKGKCHYAMNPACRPDSAGDMVLLFETKAGWNQQGGAELFTFKNHNPRGGCVLLNDGAVKFVRSKEELRTLRWK